MRSNNHAEQWCEYMGMAKYAFASGSVPKATQYFHRAQEAAARLGGDDVRRGVAYSWLAVCYFRSNNQAIANQMYREAMQIYCVSLPSGLTDEIANNLRILTRLSQEPALQHDGKMYFQNSNNELTSQSAAFQLNYRHRAWGGSNDRPSPEDVAERNAYLRQLRASMGTEPSTADQVAAFLPAEAKMPEHSPIRKLLDVFHRISTQSRKVVDKGNCVQSIVSESPSEIV